MFEFFIPKLDLIICLGATPQQIYERKPETSLEEVEKQINLLKVFCKNRRNAIWVDTGIDIEDSVYLAMQGITEMFEKRFNEKK